MKKINLKILFVIAFVIPVIFMELIIGYNTYKSYNTYRVAQNGEKLFNVFQDITRLINALSFERGATSVLLFTNGNFKKGKLSITKIVTQKRENVNNILKPLIVSLKTINKNNNYAFVKAWLKKINEINQLRTEVDLAFKKHLAIDSDFINKIFDEYTDIINQTIQLKTDFLPILPDSIKRYIYLSTSLEKTIANFSFIRGKTVSYVAANIPLKPQLYKKIYINLLTNAKTLPLMAGNAEIENLFNSKTYYQNRNNFNNLVFNIEKALQKYYLKQSNSNSEIEFNGYPYKPSQIIEKMNRYIALINQADIKITNKMKSRLVVIENKTLQNLILNIVLFGLTLLLLIMIFVLGKKINKNINLFEKSLYKLRDLVADDNEKKDKKIKEINVSTFEGMEQGLEILEETIEDAKKQRKKAEESVKAKSLFLANMSHEIRTPLNGILGFLEILQTTPLNDDQRHFVSTIEQSAKNLLQIVNNILDVSKIESNKVEIEIIPFKIEEEISGVLDIHATPIAQKNIQYVTKISPDLPKVVKGDIVKIKEILNNLINNAIKFTPHGGEIDVTVEKKEIIGNKVKVYFEVKDTGIGMTASQKEKVFKPFTQADESVTRKFGGTGLGLTIVKSYIEMMGGHIDLETEPNKGTRFFFELEFEIEDASPFYKADLFKDKHYAVLVTDKSSNRKIVTLDYLTYFGIKTTPVMDIEEYNKINENSEFDGLLIFYQETSLDKVEKILNNEDIYKIVCARVNDKTKLNINNGNVIFDPIFPKKIYKAIKERERKKEHSINKTINYDRSIKGLKALIVEDNTINQALLKKVLDKFGVKSEIANNGLEAYNKYIMNPEEYDVIFMDKQMPKMDGIEATQEILEFEKDEDISHTPIIALTANAMQGDKEELLAAGMDDYLSKPVKMDLIEEVLKKVAKGEYLTKEDLVKMSKKSTKEKEKKEEKSDNQKQSSGNNETLIILYTDSDLMEILIRNELENFDVKAEIYTCSDYECIKKYLDKKDDFSKIFIISTIDDNKISEFKDKKVEIFYAGMSDEFSNKENFIDITNFSDDSLKELIERIENDK